MFRHLVAAARALEMLVDESMLAAARWQDWLHPRGKDGRFIEVSSLVNIFADGNDLLTDKTAVRRRAKIRELRPEGAYVVYQGPDGKVIEPDPSAGFPDLIPAAELGDKVSSAPKAVAHLNKGLSAQEEYDKTYLPAMSQAEYDEAIATLDAAIRSGSPDSAASIAPGQTAMTPEEFAAHNDFVRQQTAFAFNPPTSNPEDPKARGLTYDAAFKDSNGLWSEEWQQIFDELVTETIDKVTKGGTMPKDRRAIMLGGLPGAGKSSVLKSLAENRTFRAEEWIVANPDSFKELMIEKGLYPKLTGIAPAETAGFIHAASSEMNFMLENALTVEGYNVIFDITMGGRKRDAPLGHEATIDRLTSLDYQTDGIFVDVSPNTSRSRVVARHKEGLDKLRTGTSQYGPEDPEIKYGGRAVPDAVISSNEIGTDDQAAQSAGYKSYNAKNFMQLQGEFTRWAAYDNTGEKPVWQGGSGSGEKDRENMPGYFPASPAPASSDPLPVGSPTMAGDLA